MCLAQGPQHSDAGEAEFAAPRSRVKHSTTEPLRSLLNIWFNIKKKQKKKRKKKKTIPPGRESKTSGSILKTIPPGRESKIGECHATA